MLLLSKSKFLTPKCSPKQFDFKFNLAANIVVISKRRIFQQSYSSVVWGGITAYLIRYLQQRKHACKLRKCVNKAVIAEGVVELSVQAAIML